LPAPVGKIAILITHTPSHWKIACARFSIAKTPAPAPAPPGGFCGDSPAGWGRFPVQSGRTWCRTWGRPSIGRRRSRPCARVLDRRWPTGRRVHPAGRTGRPPAEYAGVGARPPGLCGAEARPTATCGRRTVRGTAATNLVVVHRAGREGEWAWADLEQLIRAGYADRRRGRPPGPPRFALPGAQTGPPSAMVNLRLAAGLDNRSAEPDRLGPVRCFRPTRRATVMSGWGTARRGGGPARSPPDSRMRAVRGARPCCTAPAAGRTWCWPPWSATTPPGCASPPEVSWFGGRPMGGGGYPVGRGWVEPLPVRTPTRRARRWPEDAVIVLGGDRRRPARAQLRHAQYRRRGSRSARHARRARARWVPGCRSGPGSACGRPIAARAAGCRCAFWTPGCCPSRSVRPWTSAACCSDDPNRPRNLVGKRAPCTAGRTAGRFSAPASRSPTNLGRAVQRRGRSSRSNNGDRAVDVAGPGERRGHGVRRSSAGIGRGTARLRPGRPARAFRSVG